MSQLRAQEAAMSWSSTKKRKVPCSSSAGTTNTTISTGTNKKSTSRTSTSPYSLLSPQLFEECISKLNLHILPPPAGEKDHQDHQESTSDDLGATTAAPLRHTGRTVSCTKEAMEILRQCHGQFIALLASELATSSSCTDNDTHSSCRKDPCMSSRHHPERRAKVGGQNESAETAAVETEQTVKTITPTHVKIALERLDFQSIVSSPKFHELYTRMMNNEGAGKRKGVAKGTDSARIKKAVKNRAMMADLLKEQERLLALSADKLKHASVNAQLQKK